MKFLLGLVAFTIVLRVVPYVLTSYDIKTDSNAFFYPWNFSPLMAVCLYSGAYMNDRRSRFGLPLLALLGSDLAIWAATGQFSWAFPSDRWCAYLCNVIAVVMGAGLNRQTGLSRVASAVRQGVFAEVLFYVVTNFAYFYTQTTPPHTAAGLMACYVAALPYVKYSLLSTLFYSAVLFSPLADRTMLGSEPSRDTLEPLQPVQSI
ncbi:MULTISPECIES: DUF6580 family putative transport protein [unclassified Schlesneria]|uniref:DUF6580 family putative transport protein n=1 Tax=Schlesneria TaxID=656899 RepID=UPI002F1752DC